MTRLRLAALEGGKECAQAAAGRRVACGAGRSGAVPQTRAPRVSADAVLLRPPEGHDSLHQPSRLSALWCVRLCALCPCPYCVAELLHLAVRRLHSHDGHSCLR